LFSAVIT